MSVLTCVIESMGSSCSRSHSFDETEAAENAKVTYLLDQANAVSMFHFCVGKKQHSYLLTLVEWVQSADIDRRILQETKAEQHIHKLLLLGNANLLELEVFCHVKYTCFVDFCLDSLLGQPKELS